jgi:hypothetical protein
LDGCASAPSATLAIEDTAVAAADDGTGGEIVIEMGGVPAAAAAAAAAAVVDVGTSCTVTVATSVDCVDDPPMDDSGTATPTEAVTARSEDDAAAAAAGAGDASAAFDAASFSSMTSVAVTVVVGASSLPTEVGVTRVTLRTGRFPTTGFRREFGMVLIV